MNAALPQGAPAAAPTTPKANAIQGLTTRLLVGLLGVRLASLLAGLNGSVVSAAMADVLGGFSMGHDESRWLSAAYRASEVAAMAFAPWCAVTFSLRRFTLFAIGGLILLGLLCPIAPNYPALVTLRAAQGWMAGSLPPVLMTVALRFLPPQFRLFGLAGYALTATFGPNLSLPLAALWTESLGWQWLFIQVLPVGLISLAAVAWGLPQDPLRLERFQQFNWLGVATGLPAICALVIGLLQGDWLGWFQSPLIGGLLVGGSLLLVLFLINESLQPVPFFGLGILKRRNFSHALVTLTGTLIIFSTSMGVTAGYLASIQGYRPLQSAPVALLIAVPQLIVLPALAALCNRRWMDCRWLMIVGLGLCALSLVAMSKVTSDWSRTSYYAPLALQVLGQPMVVIALLMSSTSVVTPAEGPLASAWFNTIRSIAGVVGTAVTTGLLRLQGETHGTQLADQVGGHPQALGFEVQQLMQSGARTIPDALSALGHQVAAQAHVLAAADLYQLMALLSLMLLVAVPLVPRRVLPPMATVR